MQVTQLSNDTNIKKLLKQINVDSGGVSILASKAKHYILSIKNLHVGAANILKQDALSVGADLAVPRGTVVATTPEVDCVLIATQRQLQKLIQKEKAQPFGLKNLSAELEKIATVKKTYTAKVMGVLNANDDSFFAQSRFSAKEAQQKIEQMIADGADIIDIGGVSSRPGSQSVSAKEELRRVGDIYDLVRREKLYEKVVFSCDSYEPRVIEYALDCGFSMVNDITGLQNNEVVALCAKYKASVVIMHMQGTPQTMQNNPKYDDVLSEVYGFLKQQVHKAHAAGIEDVIVDVGIGFGKRLEDNVALIQHLEHFKTLGSPILVGASRKSMIDQITPSAVEDRLGGTLALHLEAVRNGAEILRVHDVYEHLQALRVFERLYT